MASEGNPMTARWSKPSGAQWTIGAGAQQATVVEVGGGLREYTVAGVPVVDPYPATSVCPRSAGQLLAPWPNRLGGGRYNFDGTAYQLPITEVTRGNASHGLVRWVTWQRVEQTPESIELTCVLPPQPGYPFALGLSTTWSIGPDGLRADHTAVNLGATAAPFGFGAHPYLRIGDAQLDDLVLHLTAAERLTVDERLLPTGRADVTGTALDFTTPRKIGSVQLDTTFTRLDRGADGIARTRLTTPDGAGVELWQGATFDWVQVYSGIGPSGSQRHTLAVEPMTCPPDAFNSGVALNILQPGDRWTGSWGITPLG
jgi:aldose 1-epimerase